MDEQDDLPRQSLSSSTSASAASIIMKDEDNEQDGCNLFLLSAAEIQQLRGRYEQLEYEMMSNSSPATATATTTTTTMTTSSTPTWKEFRRVYVELDILQEELHRNHNLLEDETVKVPRVNAQDLVRLLKDHCHAQLWQLWKDATMNHAESTTLATAVATSTTTGIVQQEVTMHESTIIPRAIDQPPLVASTWVDFMPSPNHERSTTVVQEQERHETRNVVPSSSYSNYYHYANRINNNNIVPNNIVIADISGHTSDETMSDHGNKDDQRRRIMLLLDQCEATKFPFKKRLLLHRMGMTNTDLPITHLLRTPLGNALHKLSLAGNPLGTIPHQMVQALPCLRHLDLSECELHGLPHTWKLPMLKKLNLSHNRLRDFPQEVRGIKKKMVLYCMFVQRSYIVSRFLIEQSVWTGLPELVELNMYGNKIVTIVVPTKASVLTKLEVLNVGYNDLAYLPPDMDQLVSLKSLKAMNNFIEQVPKRICDMNLKMIDVTFNPVIQPPLETCERGIASMRRYYYALQMEQEATQRASESFYSRLRRSI